MTCIFSESHSYSESKIVALFEKYKDEEEDCVLSEGIEEFCMDLQLKPDEFKVLGKKNQSTMRVETLNFVLQEML